MANHACIRASTFWWGVKDLCGKPCCVSIISWIGVRLLRSSPRFSILSSMPPNKCLYLSNKASRGAPFADHPPGFFKGSFMPFCSAQSARTISSPSFLALCTVASSVTMPPRSEIVKLWL